MTRILFERLLQVLSDSHLTAKFQQMCGVRSNVSKFTGANGNGLAGGCGAGVSSFKFTGTSSSCNNSAKSEKNGQDDCYTNGFNHNGNILSEMSKECTVQQKNGYKNGLTLNVQNELSSRKNKVTNTLPDLKRNGKETELRESENSKRQANKTSSRTYTIENPLLYYIFSFGASLGNELFYILFFSSTLWNFDSLVTRKLLIVWCVIMYLGQAAKDIIRWPRPKSPPVVRLEERYKLEYGMPSTHAMVGVAIPFGTIIFMFGRYEFNYVPVFMVAVVWSLLVSLSRLYLGMHSVLDIIAGMAYSVFLMSVTVVFVGPVDRFLMSHQLALPVTVVACIALCLLYPSLEEWSTARGDTTLVLGVFSGIYAGMWLTGRLAEFDHLPDTSLYTLELPSTRDIFLGLLRQAVGLVIVIFILTTCKTAILHGSSWLSGCDPKDPTTKQRRAVELPYKYISYYISGVVSTYLMPLVFLKLNIERQSYYSEIFS